MQIYEITKTSFISWIFLFSLYYISNIIPSKYNNCIFHFILINLSINKETLKCISIMLYKKYLKNE